MVLAHILVTLEFLKESLEKTFQKYRFSRRKDLYKSIGSAKLTMIVVIKNPIDKKQQKLKKTSR